MQKMTFNSLGKNLTQNWNEKSRVCHIFIELKKFEEYLTRIEISTLILRIT